MIVEHPVHVQTQTLIMDTEIQLQDSVLCLLTIVSVVNVMEMQVEDVPVSIDTPTLLLHTVVLLLETLPTIMLNRSIMFALQFLNISILDLPLHLQTHLQRHQRHHLQAFLQSHQLQHQLNQLRLQRLLLQPRAQLQHQLKTVLQLAKVNVNVLLIVPGLEKTSPVLSIHLAQFLPQSLSQQLVVQGQVNVVSVLLQISHVVEDVSVAENQVEEVAFFE